MISALLWTFAPRAEASDLQPEDYIAFMFFNGVNTTPESAYATLGELQREYGDHTDSGKLIRYEAMYNHSSDPFWRDDILEVFEQRAVEFGAELAGRYELLDELKAGGGPWLTGLHEAIQGLPLLIGMMSGQFAAGMAGSLALDLSDPPTMEDYLEHRTRLDAHRLAGHEMLFYAHSQGNLFANAAFEYLYPDDELPPDDTVRLVHVAPASVTVHGPYALANLDEVINYLRVPGPVLAANYEIPPAEERPPGVHGAVDNKGHGLEAIYWNPALTPDPALDCHVLNALSELSGGRGWAGGPTPIPCGHRAQAPGEAPDDSPSYAVTFHLDPNELFELVTAPGNTLPPEVTSESGKYELNDVNVGAFLGAVDKGMRAWSYVLVYDGSGFVAATANTDVELDAGTGVYIREEIDVDDPLADGLVVGRRPLMPEYSPAGEDAWMGEVSDALLGKGVHKGSGTLEVGWGALHDAMPNRTVVEYSLVGKGTVKP